MFHWLSCCLPGVDGACGEGGEGVQPDATTCKQREARSTQNGGRLRMVEERQWQPGLTVKGPLQGQVQGHSVRRESPEFLDVPPPPDSGSRGRCRRGAVGVSGVLLTQGELTQ